MAALPSFFPTFNLLAIIAGRFQTDTLNHSLAADLGVPDRPYDPIKTRFEYLVHSIFSTSFAMAGPLGADAIFPFIEFSTTCLCKHFVGKILKPESYVRAHTAHRLAEYARRKDATAILHIYLGNTFDEEALANPDRVLLPNRIDHILLLPRLRLAEKEFLRPRLRGLHLLLDRHPAFLMYDESQQRRLLLSTFDFLTAQRPST